MAIDVRNIPVDLPTPTTGTLYTCSSTRQAGVKSIRITNNGSGSATVNVFAGGKRLTAPNQTIPQYHGAVLGPCTLDGGDTITGDSTIAGVSCLISLVERDK